MSEMPVGANAWAKVPAPRLSFNLRLIPGVTMLFPDGDLAQRLATARAHGFSAVEGAVPEDPRALKTALDAEGLSMLCMSAGRGPAEADAMGMGCRPGREEAFRESVKEAIAVAVEMACPMIHAVSGNVPDGPRDEYWKLYEANLAWACEQAAAAGLLVIVEPICAVRQPKYLVNTNAQMLRMIDAIGAENLCVMGDSFHTHFSGESLAEILKIHAARYPLIQFAGTPVRKQPNPDDPELQSIFASLAEQGWQGWISGEYVPEGLLSESLAWTRLAR